MEQMEDGDILLYLDCCCEVDYRKKKEFLSLFDQVKKDYIIGTHGLHPGWFEREWNKKDLLIHMDMLNNDIINSIEIKITPKSSQKKAEYQSKKS
jgi:hypothetical protein